MLPDEDRRDASLEGDEVTFGKFSIKPLHRRPWRQGFRVSWCHEEFPPRYTFFEWYLQWAVKK